MNKTCQNCNDEFAIDQDDLTFYAKVQVPPPTFCWPCRAQRRMAFRNERILYKRKSDLSGRDILSMYSLESGVKVYDTDEWLSDAWDPMWYGREVDFSRPFFEQVKELVREVPHKARNVVNGVNSDYTSNITDPKNSYLVFNASNPEDCCYGNAVNFSRDCIDTSHVTKCESCYEGFWLTSCSNCRFSSQCESCLDMWFSKDSVGCSSCFGCVGLRNKQYHVWNKPYSKEEYAATVKSYRLSSYKGIREIREKAQRFWLGFPNRFMEGLHNTNVSGNYIDHSKNVRNSFLVRDGENLRYCQYVQESPGSRDSYDYSIWGDSSELLYECHASGIGLSRSKFCLFAQESCSDLEYCMVCQTSSHLFGCVGLRNKKYCILNRQYSEEGYKALAEKVRRHMNDMPYLDLKRRVYRYGEFFPIEMSPVSYNESMAQEFFPLSKEEATGQGYRWKNMEERDYKITIPKDTLPDSVEEVQDNIKDAIIECEHQGMCDQLCTTAFRIIPRELQFYRKVGLPLPRLCPNCRTFERLKQRSGLKTEHRRCMCEGVGRGEYKNTAEHSHGALPCPNEFETAYLPGRPEIIYCEQCYLAEVA
jgi:hypothetical protein